MFEILNYLNDHKLLGMVVIAGIAYLLMRLVTRSAPHRRRHRSLLRPATRDAVPRLHAPRLQKRR